MTHASLGHVNMSLYKTTHSDEKHFKATKAILLHISKYIIQPFIILVSCCICVIFLDLSFESVVTKMFSFFILIGWCQIATAFISGGYTFCSQKAFVCSNDNYCIKAWRVDKRDGQTHVQCKIGCISSYLQEIN